MIEALENEVYSRIAWKEFQAASSLLKGLWNITIPQAYFEKILASERSRLRTSHQKKGAAELLKQLENHSFNIRGSQLVESRQNIESESEALAQSLAFDMLLLVIKAERRRLLALYYEAGEGALLEALDS